MKEENQKWLRLDGEEGWQIVVPETDSKPHSNDRTKLAYLDCPCKPKVNVFDKIIVHSSFKDKDRINQSMVVNLHENPDEMDLI